MNPFADTTLRKRIGLGVAALLVGAVYLFHLGSPLLWGDEAGTGVFARNILRTGLPVATDGRNISIYDGGAELNEDLVVVKIPWVQYYCAALSVVLFGDTTRGIRTLFALIGLATLVPLWAVLRRRSPYPLVLAAAILLSPQVLLFHRNARYFPILTLLYAVVVWLVASPELSRKVRLCVAIVCFVLLFHTHPLTATTCSVALLLLDAVRRDRRFIDDLLACGLGFGSWLAWSKLLGPPLVPQPPLTLLAKGLLDWLQGAGRDTVAAVIDVDTVNCVPVLLWGLVILAGLLFAPKRLLAALREPVNAFILLSLAVHVLGVAAAVSKPGDKQLRYMPHLIAFGLLPLFSALQALGRRPPLVLALCLLAVATNLLTLSWWLRPYAREIPWSWWPATYAEIARPEPEAWDAVIERIRSGPPRSDGKSPTVFVIPSWMQEIVIYYLGDRVISVPMIERDSRAEDVVRERLGADFLERTRGDPDWAVLFHPDGRREFPDYERIDIPVYRTRPDDGTRPELTRHTFRQDVCLGMAYLYRRL